MENKGDILIEEKQFDFIDEGFIRPTSPIRRFSQGTNRFYYKIDDNGKVTLYSSATTLIKDGYAEDSKHLEDWRNKLKAEGKNPSYELTYAATRGTILHTLAGDYIQQKVITLNDLHGYISKFHPSTTTEPLYYEVMSKDSLWLQKSLLSFSKFCRDYKVRPLAIELMMASDVYKVASPIDIICKLTIVEKGFGVEVYKSGPRKGEPKEVKVEREITAIVDLKSSKAFVDKYYFQLQLYKRIFEENYPNIKVDGLFNWSPKEWRDNPDYNFKDQLNSNPSLSPLCESVFQQGMLKHMNKTPMVDMVPDILSFSTESPFKRVPLTEYLENYHGERNKEEKRK